MSPRIVSAEEAQKLLDGIPDAPIVKHKDEAWRDDAGDLKYAASFNRLYPGYREMFIAAPDLAATVIRLHEERDEARAEAARLRVKLNDIRRESDDAINETGHFRDGITEAIGMEWRPVPQPLGGVAYVCPDDRDIIAAVQKGREERDRLRDILAAERGERAPEGWTWSALMDQWVRDTHVTLRVQRFTIGWRYCAAGVWSDERHTYALEAIEAADRAASGAA